MRLQHKLFGPMLLITVIPLMLIGGAAYQFVINTTKDSITNNVRDISQTLIPSINDRIINAEANLKLFASSRLLQDYINQGDERFSLLQPALLRQLRDYQYVYPDYFSIQLILNTGEVDSAVDNRKYSDVAFDQSDWGFYKLLSKTPLDKVITQIEKSDGHDSGYRVNSGLVLASKQDGQTLDQKKAGRTYFTLSMSLNFIQVLLNGLSNDESNLYLVSDSHKRILYSSDKKNRFSSVDLNSVQEDSEGFISFSSSEDKFYLAKFKLKAGLHLQSLVPVSRFNLSANRLASIIVLAVIGVLFFIMLLSFLYLRQLVLNPINVLRSIVTDIGKGKMDSPVQLQNRNDEIGELSGSILEMRGNIESNNNKIEQLAYFDNLTGLPNRITLHNELAVSIERSKRHKRSFALVFLDLDNFKTVNDTLGHDSGDLLLVETANRIKRSLRIEDYIVRNKRDLESSSLVARLGGDEFTILINDISDLETIDIPLTRLLNGLSKPFIIKGQDISVGASIGVATFPEDGEDVSELLKNADLAMYEAKRKGKNCYSFYSQEMNIAVKERHALESHLRKAIENKELYLQYQPRLTTNSNQIDGFEALLRWENPTLGLVYPTQFIPIAEQNLQILPIGEWVLRQTCLKIKHWISIGYVDICVSVNVTSVQLYRSDMYDLLKGLLNFYDIPGTSLELEITESGLLEDEGHAINELNKIRTLGIRIALDDFGTGYSSLSYLRILPIDILKIDRSFIFDINTNDDTINIFESIVELSKKLKLKTVAEGVENIKQHQKMISAKCDYVQGFYYARPLTEEDADAYLTSRPILPKG